jgi:endonuclease/exonuclease/phosphatase family metal-dependent hydrolase
MRTARFQASLVAVLAFACAVWTPRAAQADKPEQGTSGESGRFKILTWNIQMLPTSPDVDKLRKKQALRAPWIIDYLNLQDYDVVVLQEVIDKKMTALLKDGLKQTYPHVVAVDGKRGFTGCSGGILFAAKFPIKYVAHIVYENISGVDRMAEKGCVMVEGELDGVRFQIAGTHLQAGNDDARRKEVPEIYDGIIGPHKTDGVPQLLVGDMNMDVKTDDYRTLLATTEMRDFPLDDPRPFTTDGLNSWQKGQKKQKRIDHILLNPRGTGTTIVRQTVQRARHEHEGAIMDLADHYGVVAEVELKK